MFAFVTLFALVCSSHSVPISDLLLSFIEEEESKVSHLAAEAEKAYAHRSKHVQECICSRHSCSEDSGPDARCYPDLGTLPVCGESCRGSLLNYNSSNVRLAPGSDPARLSPKVRETLCTFRTLDTVFAAQYPETKTWTYVGSVDGTFRVFPTRHYPKGLRDGDQQLRGCKKYDPRLRPWYIAASTGPKDVVILLDTSGDTESSKARWMLMEKKVEFLLRTFTFVDFTNIVVVAGQAHELWEASPLLSSSPRNKALLKSRLGDVVPGGMLDFNVGIQKAFDLLQAAAKSKQPRQSSGCSKIIISLTWGWDCSLSKISKGCSVAGGPKEVLNNIDERQNALETSTGSKALIFTFSIGDDADDSLPRQIACRNGGAWSYFLQEDDMLNLNSYYAFLAAGQNSRKPVWVDPYEDSNGLGMLTTVSKPLYSPDGLHGAKGVLIGVAGRDVMLQELEVGNVTHQEVLNELVGRSRECRHHKLNGCQLQVQRESFTDDSTCPDILPDAKCYKFNEKWYQRFDTPRNWNSAKRICKREGGALASIRSKQHLSFVASMSAPSGSWLGARRQEGSEAPSKTVFVWEDGDVDPLKRRSKYWSRRAPHQEPNEGGTCARVDPSGAERNINDAPCKNALSFICEFDSQPGKCQNHTVDVVVEEPFKVPPLSSCQREGPFNTTKVVDFARAVSPSTALCDMGADTQKDYKEMVCCAECLEGSAAPPGAKAAFPTDVCEDNDDRVCDNHSIVRNVLLRLCAFGNNQQACCEFIRAKRQKQDWGFFKACVCSRGNVCDIQPFINLTALFGRCGVPLGSVPVC